MRGQDARTLFDRVSRERKENFFLTRKIPGRETGSTAAGFFPPGD